MIIKHLIFEGLVGFDEYQEFISFRKKRRTDSLLGEFNVFHLSSQYLGNEFVFTPRIPRHPYVDVNQHVIEDDITPRVSLAKSVSEAFSALQGNSDTGDYFIYAAKISDSVESVKDNIEFCPQSENNPYGTSFNMKDWLVDKLVPPSKKDDEEYVEAVSDKIDSKKFSPQKLNKELEGRLGDEFEGCVPDAIETDELWSAEPIKMLCVGLLDGSPEKFFPSKALIELELGNS